MSANMIEISGMTKAFHRGEVNEVLALDDVSVDVRDGDFITIIGSNGAGKSTFLNAVSGCFPLDRGKIVLNGKNVTGWPEYKRASMIGRVFQDPLLGTCASATIEQNMALALKRGRRRGLGYGVKKKYKALFRDKLSMLSLGLEDRLGDVAGLLSGGQRQAMTMLMSTLVRPKLLLLDEHTAALDPKTAHQILDLTEELVTSMKLTTMMVTHNMNQAIELGNRLLMFHRGQIILDIEGEEKRNLRVEDLLQRFYELRGEDFVSDRTLLA